MTKALKCCAAALIIIAVNNSCSKKDAVSGLTVGNTENTKAVGASANELLSATKYTSAIIEMQYMPGYQPDVSSVNNLVNFINLLANKPGGITVVQSAIASGGKSVYSLDDVAAIEKTNRTKYNSGTQIALNFLYVDGNYTTDNVLGFAYRNTSMCIFAKKVADNSGGIGQVSRTKLESTILEHEMGHLLGLVNLGSAMQTAHEDAANAKHCNNSNCLMYYEVQTTGIMGPLMNGNIPALDANCRADLHANGGK
ncbi:M12 family metallo-peptidase [Ferruginibacter sp.]